MLHRYPDGTSGEKIYQKRLPKGAPDWVETVEVRFPSGRTADELCVTELASVVWAVQMSTVEFHPWHSRRADTERPDELRIDLDPQPGTGFRRVQAGGRGGARGARRARRGRAGRRRPGRRGMHIYVRIEPRFGFREVRRAALAFAREVERRIPAQVTTAWWKEERGAQVFLDYNQNARDRTIAAAYSVRGTPRGLVSAPVTWDELPDVEIEDFTIATMPARFAELGDLHAGHRRRGVVDRAAAGMGRPRRARPRPGRRAVPAELPEAGGRAAARPAVEEGRRALGRRGQPHRR